MTIGRPSKFTPEIGDDICRRVVEGQTIRIICKDLDINLSTFFYWLRSFEIFSKQYAQAKQEQAEYLAEEIVDIADSPPERDANGNYSNAYIQWQKLRVDARKWTASKLKPKKFGSDSILALQSGDDKKDLRPIVILNKEV